MDRLSERQREIIAMVAAGLTSKAIAARLTLSESAVKWHISRLMERYGAESRSQLVALLLAGHRGSDARGPRGEE